MRYARVGADFARVRDLYAGIGVFFVPQTQTEAVVQALRAGDPAWRRADWAELPALRARPTGPPGLFVGLPATDGEGDALLDALNSARDAMRDRGRLLALVLEPADLERFRARCGDVYSALAFSVDVAFEPDPKISLAAGRRALAEACAARFGRLDLRGLVRSDVEDVGWPAAALYQAARVETPPPPDALDRLGRRGLVPPRPRSADAFLRAEVRSPAKRPVVLLGGPGAGKSRYLRHLALEGSTRGALLAVRAPLVVLLPLGAWAAELRHGLRDVLIRHLLTFAPAAAHVLDRAAAAGRLILLLDGLDEVHDPSEAAAAVEDARASLRPTLLVVTSRPAGHRPERLPTARTATLAPLDRDQIRAFLGTWCELYARDLHGDRPEVRARGRAEGERLSAEILGRPRLAELAGSPLLLSIIGLVHRTGVRLPDHRVELYAHMAHVLVERWNRFRSEGGHDAPPVKLGDVQRILGPLALRGIESGARSGFEEAWVRDAIERALGGGRVRAAVDADGMLRLFRETLGLLVETSPGRYGFLHLSLAEFLAARELIRTETLGELIDAPARLFADEWREVVLLALGELGLVRAEDTAVARAVRGILATAARVEGEAPGGVVPLLNGILEDEPGLDETLTDALVDYASRTWWFRDPSDPWAVQTAWFFWDRVERENHWSRRFRQRCGGVMPSTWFPPPVREGEGVEHAWTAVFFLLRAGWSPSPTLVGRYAEGEAFASHVVRWVLSSTFSRAEDSSVTKDGTITLRFAARGVELADRRPETWDLVLWPMVPEAPNDEADRSIKVAWETRRITSDANAAGTLTVTLPTNLTPGVRLAALHFSRRLPPPPASPPRPETTAES